MLLVTGGAGFIGANFIYSTLAQDPTRHIVCADSLTYAGNLYTLDAAIASGRVQFAQVDIADAWAVEALWQRYPIDEVVNFAAESHVDRSILDPALFVRTNVLGTANLLDAALRHGVRRFHQVSTDEVYGDLPLDSTAAFTEGDPLRPSSPYSSSKAAADLLALSYCRTYGLPVTVSRAGNNYGPYQFPEKLIPLTIVRALSGQTVPVYGTGANMREWMHVSDHCSAIRCILRHGEAGQIYNVGGGTQYRNIDLVRQVLALVGAPPDRVEYVADRLGHDRRYALSAAPLRALGWAPEVPFDEGLADTVHWYLDHPSWWQDILSGAYRLHPIPHA